MCATGVGLRMYYRHVFVLCLKNAFLCVVHADVCVCYICVSKTCVFVCVKNVCVCVY